MCRLLILIIFIAGAAIGFSRISRIFPEKKTNYQITALNASHIKNTSIIDYNEDYCLRLSFVHNNDSLPKKNKEKDIERSYYAINPITELKIVSTAKLDETHPAFTDISALFNFHYVRNLKTTQGCLIKEGMTIPLNDFIYTINQNESVHQLKEFKLQLTQKPILQSQLQFIVTAKLENGQILSDTTSKITFEGINQ
jgi:hypothetical protein